MTFIRSPVEKHTSLPESSYTEPEQRWKKCDPVSSSIIFIFNIFTKQYKYDDHLPWKYTPEHTCRILGKLVSSKDAKYSWSGKAKAPAIALSSMCCSQKWKQEVNDKRSKKKTKRGRRSRSSKPQEWTRKLQELFAQVLHAVVKAVRYDSGLVFGDSAFYYSITKRWMAFFLLMPYKYVHLNLWKTQSENNIFSSVRSIKFNSTKHIVAGINMFYYRQKD